MKEFYVSYLLGEFYHSFIIEAENEAEAIFKALNMMGNRSRSHLHNFKIEEYVQKWN